MDIKALILVLMSGVLANNYVLQKFLGICPFLGVSKKVGQAAGMGFAVTFVMLLASAVTHPIYYFLLSRFELEYLQTIVFIVVCAVMILIRYGKYWYLQLTYHNGPPSEHKIFVYLNPGFAIYVVICAMDFLSYIF